MLKIIYIPFHILFFLISFEIKNVEFSYYKSINILNNDMNLLY